MCLSCSSKHPSLPYIHSPLQQTYIHTYIHFVTCNMLSDNTENILHWSYEDCLLRLLPMFIHSLKGLARSIFAFSWNLLFAFDSSILTSLCLAIFLAAEVLEDMIVRSLSLSLLAVLSRGRSKCSTPGPIRQWCCYYSLPPLII